jgi:tRNA G37 N-methylase Trm5
MGATNPVVAGGRLWLRDDKRLFCYDVRRDALDRPTLATSITLRPPESKRATSQPTEDNLSVFVSTPRDVVEKMLELAAVKTSDVVYDLGSGDGRIVMTAAQKYGCRAVGYEINRELVHLSRENARKAGLEPLVKFENRDIFTVDLSGADVIAVYLLPIQLEKLIPQLETLKPGSRIVSHQFEIPGINPDRIVTIESNEDGDRHTLNLWTTPLRIAGVKGE